MTTPGDIALDIDTNDLVFTASGDLALATRLDAVRQRVALVLRTQRGEWFTDQRLGVDYRRAVFVKNPDLALIRGVIASAIRSVDEVRNVRSVSVDVGADRVAHITFEATTTQGIINGEVSA